MMAYLSKNEYHHLILYIFMTNTVDEISFDVKMSVVAPSPNKKSYSILKISGGI